jgi:DNA-binding GntR family transcriptional regulator
MSDMMKSSPALETVSVVDALRAALRERILDGSWPPGAPVAEVDVARDYRVSRPSAKTAIRALVFEGLLHHEANRAARVATPDPAGVADLFLVRIPLELTAVERVAALDDAHRAAAVREARAAVRALRTLPAAAPHTDFVHADLSFHQRLVDATASPRLSRVYDGLRGEIHLCMVHTRRALGRDRIVREHAAILHGIESGDLATADLLMRDHLTGARDALLDALTAHSRTEGHA